MTKPATLNLDELFGTKEPVVVVLDSHRYELKRPDAWSPAQYNLYMSLQHSLNPKDVENAADDPASFTQLTDTVQKILEIISPQLAGLGLSFEMQSAVVNHYTEAVFPTQLAAAKTQAEMRAIVKEKERSKNMTGA